MAKIMYMILIAFVVALCHSTPLGGFEDDEIEDGEYNFDTDTSELETSDISPKDFDNDDDSDISSNDDDEDEMVNENDKEDDDDEEEDDEEAEEEEEEEENQNSKNDEHERKSNDEVPTSDSDGDDNDDDDDDDSDDDDEEEEDEMAVFKIDGTDKDLIKLLAKPKRTESELLNIFVKILHSYTKMAVGQPEYANITSAINEFLKNPTRQELFVLFKNTSIFAADGGSDELPRLIREFEMITTNSSEDVFEVSAEETDENDNSDQIIVPPDMSDTLDYLVDPDIPKALDATEQLNALESEHSRNNTVVDQGGFELVNMTSQFQSTKGLQRKHLIKRIKRELEGTVEQEEILKGILDNILDHVEHGNKKQPDALFSVITDAGNGFANAIFIYYKERKDGKYNMKKLRFEGKIKLAATLVITRVTTSNLTHSESKDIISYVPRDNATDIDVARLLKMMVPDLGKVLSKLSVDDSNKQNDFMRNKFF